MKEYQNSLIQGHGRSNVQAPESRRNKSDGMIGSEGGRVGGFPAASNSFRAFWREPREFLSKYEIAAERADKSKSLDGPGRLVGHCWIKDDNSDD
jgi:hypothetical protein